MAVVVLLNDDRASILSPAPEERDVMDAVVAPSAEQCVAALEALASHRVELENVRSPPGRRNVPAGAGKPEQSER